MSTQAVVNQFSIQTTDGSDIPWGSLNFQSTRPLLLRSFVSTRNIAGQSEWQKKTKRQTTDLWISWNTTCSHVQEQSPQFFASFHPNIINVRPCSNISQAKYGQVAIVLDFRHRGHLWSTTATGIPRHYRQAVGIVGQGQIHQGHSQSGFTRGFHGGLGWCLAMLLDSIIVFLQ